MTFALQGRQRQVVEATREFANIPPRIESEAQVARCFSGFPDFRLGSWKPMWFDPKTGQERPVNTFLEGYEKMHEVVRDWFTRIAQSATGRRAVLKEVEAAVKSSIGTTLKFQNGVLSYEYHFRGAHSVFAFGAALILDKERGLTSRLQKCVCGKFNLDLNPKGRPTRYCPEHRAGVIRKQVAKRVRKHRKANP